MLRRGVYHVTRSNCYHDFGSHEVDVGQQNEIVSCSKTSATARFAANLCQTNVRNLNNLYERRDFVDDLNQSEMLDLRRSVVFHKDVIDKFESLELLHF